MVEDVEEMKEVVEGFYGDLYAEKEIDLNTMTEVLGFLDKTVLDSELLSQDFILLELDKCVKSFKKGKSPGNDGLPLDFYLTFWDILAHDLLTVFKDLERLDQD